MLQSAAGSSVTVTRRAAVSRATGGRGSSKLSPVAASTTAASITMASTIAETEPAWEGTSPAGYRTPPGYLLIFVVGIDHSLGDYRVEPAPCLHN